MLMNSVLVCVDPVVPHKRNLQKYSKQIQFFQDKKIITSATVASVVHPALFSVPTKWYQEMKKRFVRETAEHLASVTEGCFQYDEIKVIQSDSSVTEDLVFKLSRYGKNHKHSLLVLSSSDKKGFPQWFMGSFSGSASLIAEMPVMILKPQMAPEDFASKPRFIFAVDPDLSDSPEAMKWIIQQFKGTEAAIDIVYVSHAKADKNKDQGASLEAMKKTLTLGGLKTKLVILQEKKSVAHSIVEYADDKKAWGILTLHSPGSRARKLLMGSCARQILKLTKRPFINIRLDD